MKIAYFSRGRGRGHAIADIEIAARLKPLLPAAEIVFVSYGTGARTLREHGIDVIDMGLPDANSIAATTVIAGRIVGGLRPDLVVAHEEFPALPVAKIFGMPAIFLTDFFGEPGKFSAESLWFADRILFLDRAGVHEEPPSAAGKVVYLGPQLRNFFWRRAQAKKARRELGLNPSQIVIGVFPGSWTEAMAPLAQALLTAVPKQAQLIWLADDAPAAPNVTRLPRNWQVDRYMVACDLAITKTNRMTVHELAWLGIRTLSIDYGLNDVDTACIAGLPNNHTIHLRGLNAAAIRSALRAPAPRPYRPKGKDAAGEIAATWRNLATSTS